MRETVFKLFSLLLVFSEITASEDQSGMFPVFVHSSTGQFSLYNSKHGVM